MTVQEYIINLQDLKLHHLMQVGGKNASLGEMINHLSGSEVLVPKGFATTADAFREFLTTARLDQKIYDLLETVKAENIKELAAAGKSIRQMILATQLKPNFVGAIRSAYAQMAAGHDNFTVAVRSSATAEDLPDASFAGQQDTFLNINGIEAILSAIKQVFASLFTDRAIAYRQHHGFARQEIAMSVGVQQMVRSDLATSGIMFTMDTESGFDQVIFITAAYGLGELIVQGAVNPDEFYVHKANLSAGRPAIVGRHLGSKTSKMIFADLATENKSVKTVKVAPAERSLFSLTVAEIEQLGKYALAIEEHYKRPMDIEWAKDGLDGKLYIVQARPETVKSRAHQHVLERFNIQTPGKILCEGRSIGQRIGQGRVKIIKDVNLMDELKDQEVLVAIMTDPDWEPVMKRAAAIITERGGRTCHAAIIARELGIPAIVGCTGATKILQDNQEVTVSCAEGDLGYVYEGLLPFQHSRLDVKTIPKLPVKLMLNVGSPERAFALQALPNAGIGLARLEFLISNVIGIHPRALLEYENLPDKHLKQLIATKIKPYASATEFYIERLKEGIATMAAAFYPKPVIARFSDFKSNEYANLLGGKYYEPQEENPMLGFRGASRYVADDFADCFALECMAMRRVREEMGFINVELMIPFVRTINEAKNVMATLKQHGLERGKNGLRIIMMCEIPANALLAEEFLEYFDGFSIGSNDLTQLTLGLDRDSGLVAAQFDERNAAVKALLHMAIAACKKAGKYVGICGQGPSDHQDFARWVMKEGIDSISLNPDTILDTCLFLAKENIHAKI